MCSITRRRIAWVSSTNPSRSTALHTIGWTMATYCLPSSRSPATARALSSAWNSQVLAHRS